MSEEKDKPWPKEFSPSTEAEEEMIALVISIIGNVVGPPSSHKEAATHLLKEWMKGAFELPKERELRTAIYLYAMQQYLLDSKPGDLKRKSRGKHAKRKKGRSVKA